MASLWLRQLALHLYSQVKASFLFGCLCLVTESEVWFKTKWIFTQIVHFYGVKMFI